ncbi:hypothetical protein [Leptolyngbya sp. FACHB-261]|uniref:hypothetical protein n=1 Tax=Leptolyngbya sp. FACHB-261 TaxID=2692806 RepID=UPI0016894275|nr:hypothetical protein [Leptolyngbya sp. FACHB-261]MBD2102822.1 hypothetical protein [Leptolyngbya sp. FACHB-261]
MISSHPSPSQKRLQLWDYISRELKLMPSLKLILLVLANYTNPHSYKANIPASLIIRDSGLRDEEIKRLLASLEAAHWVESVRVLDDAGRSVLLYNLSAQLVQRVLNPITQSL